MTLPMAAALNRALADSMEDDPRVLLLGEDIGALGGVFRITDGLLNRFGEDRVVDTPLSEATIVGSTVGLAMRGYRPVAEIQFDGFAYPAFQQFTTHLAKYRSRTQGRVAMPVVVRIPVGGGIGAIEQHSESPESYFLHTAGLKVFMPSTAADAYSLLREAIEDEDPVIFLEPKREYRTQQEIDLPIRTEAQGRARTVREGSDLTLIVYGPTVAVGLAAAEALAQEGINLEVIDLRTLIPLDEKVMLESVRKTGRVIIVHEAPRLGGFGAELAARIAEHALLHLQAPILRVTGYSTPYPTSAAEHAYLPSVDRVVDAADQLLAYN